MTTLLSGVTAALDFVIASLGSVLNVIVAEPVLLLFIALGVTGMVLGWAKSLFHA